MVKTRASSDPCVYCLETAIEFPVKLCTVCSARSCAECFEKSFKKSVLTPETMASEILCPMCRSPLLPSFAQILKEPALRDTARWTNDNSNYESFWHKVGHNAPPQKGLSRFIMCVYALAAELRMHLLEHTVAGIDRITALSRLRRRADRDDTIASLTDSAHYITGRFDDCEPWRPPPQ